MSMVMEEEFKRWTAKRKAALVMEIIQGKTKTTVAEASRAFAELLASQSRSKIAIAATDQFERRCRDIR